MKLLAFLTLTLLVDICRGNYVWNGTYWDWVVEEECCEESKPVGLLSLIRQNALGKEISDKISESGDAISKYFSDLGSKAGDTFRQAGDEIHREGDRLVSQVGKHVEKKAKAMGTQAEAYATDVQKQIDDTLQDIQKKSIVIVKDFHNDLTQSAATIRKKTESFIESFGKAMQSQLASFWESLTKEN